MSDHGNDDSGLGSTGKAANGSEDCAQARSAETPPADADAEATPGRVVIMPPAGDYFRRAGADGEAGAANAAPNHARPGRRKLAAVAAVFVLAATAGVIGGSLVTAGLGRLLASDATRTVSPEARTLEASIRQIGADVAALKSSVERSARLDAAQFAKVNDRIEKIEKGQIEPAARLARIGETLEKLRIAAAPAPAAPAALASEITGSIPTPVSAPNRPEIKRLPTIDGWRIRDVANGGALVEGRDGLYEVYAGDPLPGLGRVDAIRRQDGRWVVVTGRGLIVAR